MLPVLAELDRIGQCERIEVRPFERRATAELIAGLDPAGPSDPGYVDDVQRRTGGNPFFIEELIAGRTAGVPQLSDTLREVIRARAVALDEVSLDVLGAVATAGATTPEVLAEVCALDGGTLRTTLERLLASALLVPDGEDVRFRHELAARCSTTTLSLDSRLGSMLRWPEASRSDDRNGWVRSPTTGRPPTTTQVDLRGDGLNYAPDGALPPVHDPGRYREVVNAGGAPSEMVIDETAVRTDTSSVTSA